MQIPIVDYRSNDAAARFIKSIKESGFGVLNNTFVERDLLKNVYNDWEHFFARDLEYKEKFKFNVELQDGYFPINSEKAKGASVADLKEFIHHFPNREKSTIKVSDSTKVLCMALEDLAVEILEWLEDAAPKGLPQDWGSMVGNSQQTLYRVIHYPPLTGLKAQEGAVRAAAHEDINFITLLPAATESGLEVLNRKGEWQKIHTDSSSIVVNVGDMLDLMTEGFYRSTTHRVVNPSGEAASKSRYSMPLFLHPHPETQLSANKTAGQYLDERLKELGLK